MVRSISILDDQMFKHVFGRDPKLCRRLIELALEIPITKVSFVEAEHESRDVNKPGGTYFDVLATTESGELIDVEMQAENRPGILQRARLYSGRLTAEAWSRYTRDHDSYDFREMPKVAVIFICDFDPLGSGVRRYTGKTQYTGTDGSTDDGAITVLLNARGSGDEIEPDLAAFLDYVAHDRFTPGTSNFVDDVAREVAVAKRAAGFQEGLMNMDEKLWWSKQDGMSEGAEQRQQQIADLAERMAADGRKDELVDVLTDSNRLEHELLHYGITGKKK